MGMEKWRVKNRTRGAVEIGSVRSEALQPGESYVFPGPPPEPLRWLEGAKKVFLTQVSAAEPTPAPAGGRRGRQSAQPSKDS